MICWIDPTWPFNGRNSLPHSVPARLRASAQIPNSPWSPPTISRVPSGCQATCFGLNLVLKEQINSPDETSHSSTLSLMLPGSTASCRASGENTAVWGNPKDRKMRRRLLAASVRMAIPLVLRRSSERLSGAAVISSGFASNQSWFTMLLSENEAYLQTC